MSSTLEAPAGPKAADEKTAAPATDVTKTLVECLQSTGRVGKSTVAEGFISWMRYAGVPYAAIDGDEQHRTLYHRYPDEVEKFDPTRSLNDFHAMINALPEAPVTVIDFPAQKTDFLLGAFQHFGILDWFKRTRIRPTILIFAANDSTASESASATCRYLLDQADYLLVENPARYASDAFKRTPLYRWLLDRGTPTLRLPSITEVSITEWKALERKLKKHVPLDEACAHPGLSDLIRHELQNFRNRFLAQLEDVAVPRIVRDPSLIQRKVTPDPVTDRPLGSAGLEDPWL